MEIQIHQNTWRLTAIIFIVLTIIITIISFTLSNDDLYITILKVDADLSKLSIDGQMAASYYEEAGYSYEDRDYKAVERNCRLAREYYQIESQGYKRVKAELKETKIDDPLITLYIEGLDLLSEISINLFEACEHFEVAVRYYDTYYNTGVSYDDMSYDMGTSEIEMMNEKIFLHDDNVRKYNDKLEEYRVELNKRLEK